MEKITRTQVWCLILISLKWEKHLATSWVGSPSRVALLDGEKSGWGIWLKKKRTFQETSNGTITRTSHGDIWNLDNKLEYLA